MAREMKNSGNIRVGLIPQSWQYSRFRYLGKLSKGQITVSNDDFEGLPIIGASEMLGKEPRVYTHNTYAPQCKESDILILWDGANAGIVANRLCGVVASTAAVYRTFKDCPLDKQYLFYNFKAAEPYFKSQSTGTTIPHMNPKYLDEFYALVPPKNEQKAIADFLDAKCADIDELLADLDQEVKTLADYKKSLIAEIVTHGLNSAAPMKQSGIPWAPEIPTHWKIMANKYLMHKVKMIVPKYEGQPIISLSMNGVIVRDLDAGGKMPTSFDGYQHIKPGNLLMCLFDIDVTPRCIGLIKDNGLTSPAYSQFEMLSDAYAPYYYYFYLKMDNAKELVYLSKNMRHSLNEDQFGALPCIVPPMEEQIAIANYLNEKCKVIDETIKDKNDQIEQLKAYKASLIYEYVTGKKQVI